MSDNTLQLRSRWYDMFVYEYPKVDIYQEAMDYFLELITHFDHYIDHIVISGL